MPASSGPFSLILVVDDQPADRALVSFILREAGFSVVEADSVQAAAAVIERERVAAVVLDRWLGGSDGLQLIHVLRGRPATATLPVLVVTADDAIDDRVRGMTAGATDYVVKPFEPDELVARLSAHLRTQVAWAASVQADLEQRAALVRALSSLGGRPAGSLLAVEVCERLAAGDGVLGVAVVRLGADNSVNVVAEVGRRPWHEAVDAVLSRPPDDLTTRATTAWVHSPAGSATDQVAPVVLAPIRGAAATTLLVIAGDRGWFAPPVGADRLLAIAIDAATVVGDLMANDAVDAALADERGEISAVIESSAFFPVFQPVVSLDDGAVVGYEALTRFVDGSAPQRRFEQAAVVGLGIELELVTIAAALAAARALPPGRFVSLNVSPELITTHGDRLLVDLTNEARDVVLELTEHQVVADYAALIAQLRRLRPPVELSVDDAGSGFATLRHVVLLDPDYVKLDRSWVTGIHADPIRQALIAGLCHFARRAGCQLVAEGIENEAERATLADLDVRLGQGYLLGVPAVVR